MRPAILVAGIAALLLATGTAHANEYPACAKAAPPWAEGEKTGALNIREQPNIKARIRDIAITNDLLVFNLDPTLSISEGWDYVTGVWVDRPGNPYLETSKRGWVRNKFVKWVECPKMEDDPDPERPGVVRD
jgi:hypothetical protein